MRLDITDFHYDLLCLRGNPPPVLPRGPARIFHAFRLGMPDLLNHVVVQGEVLLTTKPQNMN